MTVKDIEYFEQIIMQISYFRDGIDYSCRELASLINITHESEIDEILYTYRIQEAITTLTKIILDECESIQKLKNFIDLETPGVPPT